MATVSESELMSGGAGHVLQQAREQRAANGENGLFVGREGASGQEEGGVRGFVDGQGADVRARRVATAFDRRLKDLEHLCDAAHADGLQRVIDRLATLRGGRFDVREK